MRRRNLTTQYFFFFYYQFIPTQICHYEQIELNQRKHLIYKLKRKIKNNKIQLNQRKKWTYIT
jgi:hypothetical protein